VWRKHCKTGRKGVRRHRDYFGWGRKGGKSFTNQKRGGACQKTLRCPSVSDPVVKGKTYNETRIGRERKRRQEAIKVGEEGDVKIGNRSTKRLDDPTDKRTLKPLRKSRGVGVN